MATLEKYSSAAVFLNGALLSEATEVSLETDTAAVNILTMQRGFAGVSPGAEMTKISVTSAVPRVGMEFDFTAKAQALEVVEITIFAHSKKITTKGFIKNVKKQFGVNKEATVSFDMECAPVEESTL